MELIKAEKVKFNKNDIRCKYIKKWHLITKEKNTENVIKYCFENLVKNGIYYTLRKEKEGYTFIICEQERNEKNE